MPSLTVIDVKDFAISKDGKEASFKLVTKYSGDVLVTLPATSLDALSAMRGGQPNEPARPATKPGELEVSVPKKITVTADADVHQVVVVIFDPQTPQQAAFAISPDAAFELATGLVKNSDIVSKR